MGRKQTKSRVRRECNDCGAAVGDLHMDGCDVERCPFCGMQALMCWNSDDDGNITASCCDETVSESDRMPWTGIWPGIQDCRDNDLWVKEVDNPPGSAYPVRWVPCQRDDPEAREDLNGLPVHCRWDRRLKKWVRRNNG